MRTFLVRRGCTSLAKLLFTLKRGLALIAELLQTLTVGLDLLDVLGGACNTGLIVFACSMERKWLIGNEK